MDTIVISTATSHQAAASAVALIKAGFKASTADVFYNTRRGIPPTNMVDSYPLTIAGTFNGYPMQIKVQCVTAGYGGTGPHDMLKILKCAGFEIDPNFILTDKLAVGRTINFTCMTNGHIQDHFGRHTIIPCSKRVLVEE